MADSVAHLLKEALFQQVVQNGNPYLTCETLVGRVLKNIADLAGVSFITHPSRTETFHLWHDEIKTAYESRCKKFSLEEQTIIERVLSKDYPTAPELVKFATCWMKHDPRSIYRWFAVDGILGSHPKQFVGEAFTAPSNLFQIHAQAVRQLYNHVDTPEEVKEIVQAAFQKVLQDQLVIRTEWIPHVELYIEMVGAEKVALIHTERTTPPQKSSKRKKEDSSQDPQ